MLFYDRVEIFPAAAAATAKEEVSAVTPILIAASRKGTFDETGEEEEDRFT